MTSPDLCLRLATPADLPRIAEISGQIWEGEDYVGLVAAEWLAAPGSELVVAEKSGQVIAFARWSWQSPGYAWFEGARTDPRLQNRGAGRALLTHLLERARAQGARTVALSTHRPAEASLHLVQAMGFRPAASFVWLEATQDQPVRQEGRRSPEVRPVAPAEVRPFLERSAFLAASRGYLPHSWKYYPCALAYQEWLVGCATLLGLGPAGDLRALLVVGRPQRNQGEFGIDFLEGTEEDMEILLRHALALSEDRRVVEAEVPRAGELAAPALAVFRKLGFPAWYGYEEDMFVLERTLAAP